MSTKEEKPSLGGVRIRQRKRNINVPLDTATFTEDVQEIFVNAKVSDADTVDIILDLAYKALDESSLDFNRYGDTFFEVLFTGNQLGTSADKAQDGIMPVCVLLAESTRESVLPYVKLSQSLLRRKPFLVKNLESTLSKLLRQLDFYGEEDKRKLAIACALVFAMKLGPLPDQVLLCLLDDAKVNSGTSLDFMCEFCKEWLSKDSVEELDSVLKRARLESRMLDFFPQGKRTVEEFNKYFASNGLSQLVDLNKKRFADAQLRKLEAELKEHIKEEGNVEEALELIEDKIEALKIDTSSVLPVIWTSVMDSVQRSAKSSTQQQTHQSVLRLIKQWIKLFQKYCQGSKQQLQFMNVVQTYCYEDTTILKLFPQIIKLLYDADVIDEDTILFWHKKGSSPKGRQVFMRDMEPFVKWLQEADEEDSEEESD